MGTSARGELDLNKPERDFHPDEPGNPYRLPDMDDDIPPSPAYAYSRWGNLMSPAEEFAIGSYRFTFTALTPGPFATATYNGGSPELFLLKSSTDLMKVGFPEGSTWSPANGTRTEGSVIVPFTYPDVTSQTLLLRRLHFSNGILDEMTGNVLARGTQKVVVLIHGWNPYSDANSYDDPVDDQEFYRLAKGLKSMLENWGWSLVIYRWEVDSDTGGIWGLGSNLGPINGTEAAEIGHLHGKHLGEWLAAQCEGLERVHFIAHSAGSWVARSAARFLVKTKPIDIQVTLLDPFIPDEVPLIHSNLTGPQMKALVNTTGPGRLWRVENYFANDPRTPGTNTRLFSDTLGYDYKVGIGEPADTEPLDEYRPGLQAIGPFLGYYANYGHSGPIQFFSDSVNIWRPELVENIFESDKIARFNLDRVGWSQSLAMREPFFFTQPGTNVRDGQAAVGGDVTISAMAITRTGGEAIDYRWYRDQNLLSEQTNHIAGSSTHGATAALTISNLTLADAGNYTVEATSASGLVTRSAQVRLAVVSGEPPPDLGITSVTPGTLTTMPLGQRQWITINGTGFTNTSTLLFNNGYSDFPSNPTYLDYRSSTEIRYNIAVGPTAATWTVKVENSSLDHSAPLAFYVVPADVKLIGLTITGPATINENSTTLFVALASYSDGSTSAVTASWSVGAGASVGATSGLLSTGELSADSSTTVTATFSQGGVTKTANLTVAILNVGGAGTTSRELLTNGDFSSGTSGWTAAGDFQADARFSTFHDGPGYAYLATAAGSAGNDLSGQLNQVVQIPTNASAVTLSYWYRITTQESGSATDFLFVRILNGAGTTVLRIPDSRSNLHANTQYEQRSFDLTEFAGQTVTLSFVGTTNSTNPTVFRIDDISLRAVTASTMPPGSGVIEVTRSGDTIPNGSTTTTLASRTYFSSHWMGETTALFSYRINNRGGGTLSLTGSPRVRLDGSSSFTVEQQPEANVTAGQYRTFQIRFDPQSVGVHRATVIIKSDDPNNPDYRFAISGEGKFRDTAAPTVTINTPTNAAILATGTATLTLGGTATDNVGIVEVTWFNDRGGSGIATGTHFWSADSVTLKSGSNVITITARDPSGLLGTDTLTVTYTPTVPEITVEPTTLVQTVPQGAAATSQTFTVRNSGSGTLNYAVTATSTGNWLSVTPSVGVSDGETDTFTVNYASAGLALGAHAGSISVTADGALNTPVTIPVSLRVTASTANLPYEARGTVPTGISGQAMAAAPDGGVVIFGSFSGSYSKGGQTVVSAGSSDIFAAKIDAGGQVVWLKRYGGTNEEEVWASAVHPQGGWIIGGYFSGTAVFGSSTLVSTGDRDAFIARLDANGDVLWAQRAGGSSTDYGKAVAADASGNCFLIGSFFGTATFSGGAASRTAAGSSPDIFAAKYSAAGAFQWAQSVGGSAYDDIYCATADIAGSLYIGGSFAQQASFGAITLTTANSGSSDAYVAKFSSTGAVTWAKSFGEPAGAYSGEAVTFVQADGSGACIFGGNYHGPLVSGDKQLPVQQSYTSGFVGKVDTGGTLVWLQGLQAAVFSEAQRGALLDDGGLLVAGRYGGQFSFGSSTLTGVGNALTSYPDIFFAKFNASGEPVWAVSANTANAADSLQYLGVRADGAVQALIAFGNNVATLPGVGATTLAGDGPFLTTLGPQVLNTAPSLSALSDVVLVEDETSAPIAIAIGDLESAAGNLLLSASSSNPVLVPETNLVFGGTDSARNLIIIPAANQSGTTTITVTVSDGALTTSANFKVSVTAVNDAPGKPINVSPADQATNQPLTLTLTSSVYADPEGDIHAASQWQILAATTDTVLWNSGEDALNLTQRTVPDGQLINGGSYRWQVRFRDSHGAWSEYSDPTRFSTPAKLGQTISFAALNDVANTPAGVALNASASSGLPVSFVVVSGPATIYGQTLTLTGTGAVVIRASQEGDDIFAAAPTVDRTFAVVPAFSLSLNKNGSGTITSTPAGFSVDAAAQLYASGAQVNVNVEAATGHYIKSISLVPSIGNPIDEFEKYVVLASLSTPPGGSGLGTHFAAPIVMDRDKLITVTFAPDPLPAMSFDSWRAVKFNASEWSDSNVSGPNSDPDGDGLPNLVEYALDLEPKRSSSTGVPEVKIYANEWIFSYSRPSDRSDLVYVVEVSTDLVTWTTANVVHELSSSSGGVENWRARYPADTASKLFFRLKVTRN